jgi:hypothetical protein
MLKAGTWRWICAVVSLTALAYFLAFFRPASWKPSVDAAWALAVAGLVAAFWRADTPSLPGLRHPYWLYALYVAAFLPFATDWRWAMTGDSLGWAFGGLSIAAHGPDRSLLSGNGVAQFGYLQMTLHNAFMLLVAPTLFWHRAGQIVVGLLAVVAVYTVGARLVSPLFGALVAACSSSISVMIVHTYCSYPLVDGIACGQAILAVGLWVRRDPESRRAWLALGFLSGFMLFLTPTAWFMALCVWTWLGLQAVARRWSRANLTIAVAVALISGLPMLLQWSQGHGGQLFSLVEKPAWTVEKALRLFREAASIPFASSVEVAGAFGPQLPPGFRWLFPLGMVITPLFGRRFPGSRLLACFYLVHVVILSFAQGPYAEVSVKRALVLIPMATYFVFLPFHRYLRSLPPVLLLIAIWAAFGIYDVTARMRPGRTGYNLFDGIVEAHQRFRDVPVCVVMPRDPRSAGFARGSQLDRLYGLWPHVQHVREVTDAACGRLLCYSPQADSIDLALHGYTEVPWLGSVELRCGRRPAP